MRTALNLPRRARKTRKKKTPHLHCAETPSGMSQNVAKLNAASELTWPFSVPFTFATAAAQRVSLSKQTR
jgi:hypothetical protein